MGPSPSSPDLATSGGPDDGADPGGDDRPADPGDDDKEPSDDGGGDPPADDGGNDPTDPTDGATTGGDPTAGDPTDGDPPADVPAGWTCDPTYYGAADGCDCGCGEVDPDCSDMTAAACEYCDGCGLVGGACTDAVQADDNSICIPANCGDGAVQGGEACDGSAPAEVTCADLGYADGTLGCSATTCNADLTGCNGGPAAGWTCPATYYGSDDGCDCGCGVLDPDCADGTSASCEYCGNLGSCSAVGAECDGIDAANNALCSA